MQWTSLAAFQPIRRKPPQRQATTQSKPLQTKPAHGTRHCGDTGNPPGSKIMYSHPPSCLRPVSDISKPVLPFAWWYQTKTAKIGNLIPRMKPCLLAEIELGIKCQTFGSVNISTKGRKMAF
jgi:hypothetical protein